MSYDPTLLSFPFRVKNMPPRKPEAVKPQTKSEIASERAVKDPMYRKYRVSIQIRNRIVGGIPKNIETLKAMVRGSTLPPEMQKPMVEKIADEVDATPEEPPTLTTFKKDEKGLYIEERQVKALLKEAASVKQLTKKWGLRDGIQHGLFIKPECIHMFDANKKLITEITDTFYAPVHIKNSPKGPRSAIKSGDFVSKPLLETFEVWLATPVITDEEVKLMFTLGQEIGLGANRSQSEGKFDLVEFAVIPEPPQPSK